MKATKQRMDRIKGCKCEYFVDNVLGVKIKTTECNQCKALRIKSERSELIEEIGFKPFTVEDFTKACGIIASTIQESIEFRKK